MRSHKAKDEAGSALFRIFKEQYPELHWLSQLLTGDSERIAPALTGGLDFEDTANPVFAEFMATWSRKLVIAESLGAITAELRESALRTQRLPPPDSAGLDGLPAPTAGFQNITKQEFERAILAIDVFPRCVLLLPVFEKLSIDET